MTEKAKVVRDEGVLRAEIVRTEACAKCGACNFGKKERLLYPLPEGDFREGDTVEIELSDRAVTKAAFLAYGMPFICLMAGLAVGCRLFERELYQALTAIGFTVIGLIYLYFTEKKRKQSGRYECRIKKE